VELGVYRVCRLVEDLGNDLEEARPIDDEVGDFVGHEIILSIAVFWDREP
jgi:hypothetical protein